MMTSHLLVSTFRRSGLDGLGRMGAVRPGAGKIGGDAARRRAP